MGAAIATGVVVSRRTRQSLDLTPRERFALGFAAFCGGMLETGIGRAAALAIASLPGLVLPTDLGPSSRYLVRDLTAPFDLDAAGCLTVPDGPGLGVEVDRDLIETACVDRWICER